MEKKRGKGGGKRKEGGGRGKGEGEGKGKCHIGTSFSPLRALVIWPYVKILICSRLL